MLVRGAQHGRKVKGHDSHGGKGPEDKPRVSHSLGVKSAWVSQVPRKEWTYGKNNSSG